MFRLLVPRYGVQRSAVAIRSSLRIIAFRRTATESRDARAREAGAQFKIDCALEDRVFDEEDRIARDAAQQAREELARVRARPRPNHPNSRAKYDATMRQIEAACEQDVKNLYTQRQNSNQ